MDKTHVKKKPFLQYTLSGSVLTFPSTVSLFIFNQTVNQTRFYPAFHFQLEHKKQEKQYIFQPRIIKLKSRGKVKRTQLTNKLKPVTVAKEVAMEAPERANSPRWPTNMIEIICKQYSNKLTAIRGPASHSCFLTSSRTPFPLLPSLQTPSSSEISINGDLRDDFSSSSSIFISSFPHTPRAREPEKQRRAMYIWRVLLFLLYLRLNFFLQGLNWPFLFIFILGDSGFSFGTLVI